MSMISLATTWEKTIADIKNKITPHSYETWITTMEPIAIKDNIFYIMVPDHFSRDWLNSSYALLFKDAVRNYNRNINNVQFIIEEQIPQMINNTTTQHQPIDDLESAPLNPRYIFDNFVVGDSNRFAHAACLAVADSPAKAYNPLFIYGGVGLGKTHLMHAIGHVIKDKNIGKVAYVTSEKFTNDFIYAIREERTVEFKNKYRNIDALLVDDIQFIAGKERTQEEFFHTFNSLYEANKQIIISSDRPPKEIPTLEDRLRSRFEWGLITDIQAPDFETRVAILQKKAQIDNLTIPESVIQFIADKITTNIRELEGALIRVAAYGSLIQEIMDIDTARKVLKDILPTKKPVEITIPLIQKKVADFYNLKIEDMKSKKRTRSISFPRQIAMYITREMTEKSLPEIGKHFGGRDHTTVLHACDKISTELVDDTTLALTIKNLMESIKQS